MCGIAGFLAPQGALPSGEFSPIVARMADALAHRGPDDRGVWTDAEAGAALGHRRLAILDLSPAGCQPMLSACGRYVLAFNGEIYNFQEIRRELEADGPLPWRGSSDTEVMLAAFARHGATGAVRRFAGMFAFALWDRRERRLHLGRDRFGEKPLYYAFLGGGLLFGSELKALRAHPAWRGEIDRQALALFLRHGCVPAPRSIYQGVRKLPPGCLLTLQPGQAPSEPEPYWSARQSLRAAKADPFVGSEAEALERIEELLGGAVQEQMVSDAPLGAFLSGGVDSSLITALMQERSLRPVRTFTIGFREAAYDEAEHAKAVARHLGSEHTELTVTPAEALAVIPKLPTIYDEPFADSSQIPTCLLSALTRRHVTVSLSGDGGDEIFLGYNRHAWGRRLWRRLDRLPRPVRFAAARLIQAFPPAGLDAAYAAMEPTLPGRLRMRNPGFKLHKLASVFGASSPEELYLRLVSLWPDPAALVFWPDSSAAGEPAIPGRLGDADLTREAPDVAERFAFLDAIGYLPDDILVKVDRASMAASLESRAPFLDHRLAEFVWRLPVDMRLTNGTTKRLLRSLLYKRVPRELIERPKAGFAAPIDVWLRGPLRDWAESLLDERRLRDEGFLKPTPIRAAWADHLSGRRDRQHELWCVLMFQAWLEEERRTTPSEG